jgi:hypothetical protein
MATKRVDGQLQVTGPVVGPVKTWNNGAFDAFVDSSIINSVVEFEGSGDRTLTVRPDSTYDAPIGTVVNICRLGTGAVTIVADSGVTILTAAPALTLRAQYSECTLRKRAANTWVLSGDLG